MNSVLKLVEQPAAKSPWQITVGGPGWLAGASGHVGFHGVNPYIDVGVGQILKHINVIYSMSGEVRKGRFGVLGGLLYLNAQAGTPQSSGVTDNCTTSIRAQRARSAQPPWDWRILVNGFADQMLYERNVLAGNLPFAELKARALINKRAQEAGDAPDFSERIRTGLAGF